MTAISALSGQVSVTNFTNTSDNGVQSRALEDRNTSNKARLADQGSISEGAKVVAAPSVQSEFATIAANARASIDSAYEKLGGVLGNRSTAKQWDVAFDGLDRRALYAVASNKGGQFSEREQEIAKTAMGNQQSEAMARANPLGNNPAAGMKAAISFLDGASAEEKTSFEWARQRAAVQFGYETLSRRDGQEPEHIDSENPLVEMIKAAMDALSAVGDPSKRLEDMPQYQRAKAFHSTQQTKPINITV